jgi:ABC-2 type transport system ATP-binding protein
MDEVLDLLGIAEKGDILAGELPRGFQQRLAFACAMLHEPEIIFLDEPTAGVDPLQRRNFWDLIYDMASRGITIFVTTHFLDEAEFCHRITLIAAGKIIATDTPSGLKAMLSEDEIYEIECEPAVKALEVMRTVEWIAQASIFGSSIHVSLHHIENGGERVKGVLTGQNVVVSRMERITPSLEDVFLRLAGG